MSDKAAYKREWRSRPEVKARMAIQRKANQPAFNLWRRNRRRTPEHIAAKNDRKRKRVPLVKWNQRPEVKARLAAQARARRASPGRGDRIRELDRKRTKRPEKRENARRYSRTYIAKKRRQDPGFSICSRLRTRLHNALRTAGATKAARTMELVGCGALFLRAYIEARFLPGMTWENRNLWHVDHRIPCAEFDLTEPAQQRQCFHYTNLQPLWKPDNLAKGAKVPTAHQAELI